MIAQARRIEIFHSQNAALPKSWLINTVAISTTGNQTRSAFGVEVYVRLRSFCSLRRIRPSFIWFVAGPAFEPPATPDDSWFTREPRAPARCIDDRSRAIKAAGVGHPVEIETRGRRVTPAASRLAHRPIKPPRGDIRARAENIFHFELKYCCQSFSLGRCPHFRHPLSPNPNGCPWRRNGRGAWSGTRAARRKSSSLRNP